MCGSCQTLLCHVCAEERGDLVEKRGSRWGDKGVENLLEFTTETEVKLIRYNAVRCVTTLMTELDPC